MRRGFIVLGVCLALVLATQALGAASSDIKPPTAKVEGATLDKWTKRFFFYDGAIPVVDGAGHPALESGDVDCGIGQFSRGVWFLETSPAIDLNGDFERRCAVPKGATLYLPVFQWFCAPEIDGAPIPECLAIADEVFGLIDLELTVDGTTLDDEALEAYRVQTGVFELPLADSNIWEHWFEVELDESITFAADAYGAFAGPWRSGEHVIRFAYSSEEFGFEGSVTYKLTVSPLKK